MNIADLISCAEKLQRRCFHLVEAKPGERIIGYWGGQRSDIPETFTPIVTHFSSRRHILSFDFSLIEELGFKCRYPFALTAWMESTGGEKARAENVKSASIKDISFQAGIPLTAQEAVSLPPLEAVCLYGDGQVNEWLKAAGLERWQYERVDRAIASEFEKIFQTHCVLYSDRTVFAQLGGWHLMWPDDDYYQPRELDLLCWTFRDAEPWYELFLSTSGNIIVKERIT